MFEWVNLRWIRSAIRRFGFGYIQSDALDRSCRKNERSGHVTGFQRGLSHLPIPPPLITHPISPLPPPMIT